jgi:glycosyltransferase involved in cell wall biosynthesis
MIPWFKAPIRRLNQKTMLRHYQRLASRYEIHDPVVVTVFPSGVDFVRAVRAKAKIYYCYDEFLEYPGFNPTDWRRMEEDLLDAVDAIVTTSKDLERKNTTSRSLLYLPHGVDFEHFSRSPAEMPPQPQMEKIRRPIVGFFGLISTWVDLELVVRLSKAYPDVSFVLIGKAEVNVDLLRACPNVQCLNAVPYSQLPEYARYFDIGLIPFRINKLTVAVNPLKLMEYFALGLPVLASRLPELEAIDGPLWLAATAEEFCDHLTSLLRTYGTHNNSAREVARRNGWDQRTRDLCKFIESLTKPNPPYDQLPASDAGSPAVGGTALLGTGSGTC